ncbi:Orange carotenoid protein [Cylindrospermum stagnale PCC 7417]|uniref:Orange carotenoid protein n=1 Tax=Cylindrospermum stagnale PCC 7417 TaxID=56107 RepID=K9WYT4_9NOST|nr:orange carotenoid protein N-terminal domain-containing protein [Cylindrospermum stagnale]AFZ24657.1 Orange carotenoid protein [Cylindrospermum stagnale PCC 7417]
MTYTNIYPLEQAVSAFNKLDIDDRLEVLALLYQQRAHLISLDDLDAIDQDSLHLMLTQIQHLTSEEKLAFLSDLLLKDDTVQGGMTLDTDTSIEVIELASSGSSYPTNEYHSLDTESKLAFWFVFAENLRELVIGIPNDYSPTAVVKKVFNSLNSLEPDELVVFLKQVL